MIRFGLLGCGRIAKRHSELLGGNHIEPAKLTDVCDLICARADAIASKFNVSAAYYVNDFLARKDIEAVASVVIYETARVAHTQYIGTNEEGRTLGALDLIFRHLLRERYAAKDYFDFGISNEDDGFYPNSGLIRNKESYGARATVFDRYSLDLSGPQDRQPDRIG